MKTIRLILLFFFLLVFANIETFSQPMKLLDENNLWSILEENVCDNPGFPDCNPYKLSHWLKTGNDTILNGKTYKVMMYSMDENHSTWEERGLFMREEEGKVFWYDQEELRKDETILYDFNLQEGESISHYYLPYPYWWTDTKIISVVDSIRHIQIGNVSRKIFYISNTLDYRPSDQEKSPEIWIEGMGSLWGLTRHFRAVGFTGSNITSWDLLCFYQNGEELYHFPKYDDCYYNWTWNRIENPELIPDFQLFPNPSSGKFTITTGNSDENSLVQIFDSVGKQIRSYRMGSSHQIEVDISNVSSGIYLVKLKSQKSSGMKKIVIWK
jgi:hypothetical protein